jgi:hypothetical protein
LAQGGQGGAAPGLPLTPTPSPAQAAPPAAGPVTQPTVQELLQRFLPTLAQQLGQEATAGRPAVPPGPNPLLRGLAYGVAGAGDLATNLMRDRRGNPLYAPGARNLSALGEINAATDKARAGQMTEAQRQIEDSRAKFMELSRFVQTAEQQQITNREARIGHLMDWGKMTPEARAIAVQGLNPVEREFFNVGAPTDARDALISGAWALDEAKAENQQRVTALEAGITALPPERRREAVESLVMGLRMPDLQDRLTAASDALKEKYGTSQIPRRAVVDAVTAGMEPSHADTYRRMLRGNYGSEQDQAKLDSFMATLGIEPSAQAKKAAEAGAEEQARVVERAKELGQDTRDALQAMGIDPTRANRDEIKQAREMGKVKEPQLAVRIAEELTYRNENPGKTKDPAFRGLTWNELMDKFRGLDLIQTLIPMPGGPGRSDRGGMGPPGSSRPAPPGFVPTP